jgi:hypothetical protein
VGDARAGSSPAFGTITNYLSQQLLFQKGLLCLVNVLFSGFSQPSFHVIAGRSPLFQEEDGLYPKKISPLKYQFFKTE